MPVIPTPSSEATTSLPPPPAPPPLPPQGNRKREGQHCSAATGACQPQGLSGRLGRDTAPAPAWAARQGQGLHNNRLIASGAGQVGGASWQPRSLFAYKARVMPL